MTTKRGNKLERSMAAALDVAARVELVEVRLVESHCAMTMAAVQPGAKLVTQLSRDVHTTLDRKGRCLAVLPAFQVSARIEGTGAKTPDVMIKARFLLTYALANVTGLRKANCQHFGAHNGVYNAWPFWREFVQSATARMGLPVLTLPVYRIGMLPTSGTRKSAREPKSA